MCFKWYNISIIIFKKMLNYSRQQYNVTSNHLTFSIVQDDNIFPAEVLLFSTLKYSFVFTINFVVYCIYYNQAKL